MKSFSLILFTCIPLLAAPSPFIVFKNGTSSMSRERTVCGKDDMQPLINQDDAIQSMGTPIGIYKVQLGLGLGHCTGTMISKDLFLTAQHCEGECNGISVTFGYLSDKKREETFVCDEIVEKGDGTSGKDYMVIRLKGNPGVNWGWYTLSDKPVQPGTSLLMLHHPSGTPMKISSRNCELINASGELLEHRCDTQPGSSGASILVPDFNHPTETRIIGIHTLGGCNSSETKWNRGPAIRELVKSSPLLKSMLKE